MLRKKEEMFRCLFPKRAEFQFLASSFSKDEQAERSSCKLQMWGRAGVACTVPDGSRCVLPPVDAVSVDCHV